MADQMPATASDYNMFKASDHQQDGKYHLLLASSGSVATIKLPNIVDALRNEPDLSIRIILTASAAEFLKGQSAEQPSREAIQQMPNVDGIYLDHDEWSPSWTRNAPILHIELRRWADSLWVVPLSANTLSKISHGLSDNLLTSVIRAWQVLPAAASDEDCRQKQRIISLAPAMNTAMWLHPLTQRHLKQIEDWQTDQGLRPWIEVLLPQEKALACGDVGSGAMREWTLIVQQIRLRIQSQGAVHHYDA